jgi:hypothetical protein
VELLDAVFLNELHSISEVHDGAARGLHTRLADGTLRTVSGVVSDLGDACGFVRDERYFVVGNVPVFLNFRSELALVPLPANGGHR